MCVFYFRQNFEFLLNEFILSAICYKEWSLIHGRYRTLAWLGAIMLHATLLETVVMLMLVKDERGFCDSYSFMDPLYIWE